MRSIKPKPKKNSRRVLFFVTGGFIVFLFTFVGWTKYLVFSELSKIAQGAIIPTEEKEEILPDPFPVGVNRIDKTINEDPIVEQYIEENLSINITMSRQQRFFDHLLSQMAKLTWYQNLASSVSRILVIYPGERREEVVSDFGDILNWNQEEKDLFSTYITETEPLLVDGKFFPGRYVVESGATPENVADLLHKRFNEKILSRYDDEVEKLVPIGQALAIASLLEREAYDFTDMRYISGIIWNRLFINMPLQLDASLQYARGSRSSEAHWWPKVVPADKYIDSPYNTYKNAGLPPAPISNPSVEAVIAALNPRVTECMFYFHDSKGKFYCTKTYAEHVSKLKEIYGRGS